MKCSNCGAEMSNLNMNWGRKQFLFIIPIMLLGFFPLIKMTLFKGDISKDLAVSEVQTRPSGRSLEILGLITNSGGRTWTGVTVEAEFYNAAGEFVDEANQYLQSDIGGKTKERFKISIPNPPKEIAGEAIKPIVKITSGRTSPF